MRSDIAEFFDHIDRSRLLDLLLEWSDAGVVELVRRLLGRQSRLAGTRYSSWAADGTAQGAPLSPLLANLFLDELDRSLARAGLVAIRFGDDLAIPSESRTSAESQLIVVEKTVKKMGMTLNQKKTEVVAFDEGFVCLGVEIGPHDPIFSGPELEIPERKAIYVTTQGSYVFVRKGQLTVQKGDEVLLSVPVSHVGQIVCFGSVGISAGLRATALMPTARAIVTGKIANQAALLTRYARRHAAPSVLAAVDQLRELRTKVVDVDGIPQLMGLEGAAARAYFSAWPSLLPDGTQFGGRTYRPPKDVVNAALSFGYSMLTGNTVAAIATTGLDPCVGVLHTEQDGRPSLALDLMEEFRPLIVDSVVIEMFRRGILDDTSGSGSGRGEGVWLEARARSRLIQRFEERLLTEFAHVPSRKRVSYRRALYLQARQMVGVFEGVREYEAVRWR